MTFRIKFWRHWWVCPISCGGAHFKAFDEGVLIAPSDARYTEVGFNFISVKCWMEQRVLSCSHIHYSRLKFCLLEVATTLKIQFRFWKTFACNGRWRGFYNELIKNHMKSLLCSNHLFFIYPNVNGKLPRNSRSGDNFLEAKVFLQNLNVIVYCCFFMSVSFKSFFSFWKKFLYHFLKYKILSKWMLFWL